MSLIQELSIKLGSEKNTTAIALSTTSAPSGVLAKTEKIAVTLVSDVMFAVVQGANPTAVFPAAGVPGHDVIPANTKVRTLIEPGNKIAAILASGTGTLYITVDG